MERTPSQMTNPVPEEHVVPEQVKNTQVAGQNSWAWQVPSQANGGICSAGAAACAQSPLENRGVASSAPQAGWVTPKTMKHKRAALARFLIRDPP